jgi:hypothetical protein
MTSHAKPRAAPITGQDGCRINRDKHSDRTHHLAEFGQHSQATFPA